MTLRSRLDRLERHDGPHDGCPACRDRRGVVALVTPREQTGPAPADWPQPCEVCGDVAEQLIEIEEVVVDGA